MFSGQAPCASLSLSHSLSLLVFLCVAFTDIAVSSEYTVSNVKAVDVKLLGETCKRK